MDNSDIRQNNVRSNQYNRPKRNNLAKSISLVLILLLLLGASFFGGVGYEKGHVKTSSTDAKSVRGGFGGGFGGASGGGGFGGGRFGGQRPVFGSVTAISPSSITVNSRTSGTSSTYAITSSTTITDNGSTVSASDIQTGDTVVISLSSTSSNTASRILVNPSFGGGQEGPSQGGSSTSTTED